MNSQEPKTPIKQLISRGLGYVAIRHRSAKELRDYFNQKCADESIVKQAIDYFNQHHLIDDVLFTNQWTESRLRHGKGDYLIQQELILKGINKETIQQVLSQITTEEWNSTMSKVIQKNQQKWQGLTAWQQRQKIYQFLRGRGFSTRHIDAFMKCEVE